MRRNTANNIMPITVSATINYAVVGQEIDSCKNVLNRRPATA
jgi:hypothetical protein